MILHKPSTFQEADKSQCGQQGVTFSSNFESGSIGSIRPIEGATPAYELSLRDDNNDPTLSAQNRTWFYVQLDNVPIDALLRLEITRLGFSNFFTPLYSYDAGATWNRFSECEVKMSPECNQGISNCRIIITKQFAQSTVRLARTYPYTTQDLSRFIDSIKSNPSVTINTLGQTPFKKFPIYEIVISDKGSLPEGKKKKTIFINARTHPAEIGSSFLLEGLIRAVLADSEEGEKLRENFVLHIVPMQNADGVIIGNYRTNASSKTLEYEWRFDRQSPAPTPLNDNVPPENQIVGNRLFQLQRDEDAPLVLSLNLHSSNSEPNDPPFLYPHFGDDPKYTAEQRALYKKQKNFIEELSRQYSGRIQSPAEDGGAGFLQTFYPETWSWHNRGSKTNAITLEVTYEKAGFGRFVIPDDWRNLGISLTKTFLVVFSDEAGGC